jgi:hypothetical protein
MTTKQQSANVQQQKQRKTMAGGRQRFVSAQHLETQGMADKGVERWRSEWD